MLRRNLELVKVVRRLFDRAKSCPRQQFVLQRGVAKSVWRGPKEENEGIAERVRNPSTPER